jgi:hypothetical protein
MLLKKYGQTKVILLWAQRKLRPNNGNIHKIEKLKSKRFLNSQMYQRKARNSLKRSINVEFVA